MSELRRRDYLYSYPARQGHTNRWQVISAVLGVGGGVMIVAWMDRYTARRRLSTNWQRTVPHESETFSNNGIVIPETQVDLSRAIRIERMTFIRLMGVPLRATLPRDFNSDFRRRAWHLNALIKARFNLQ